MLEEGELDDDLDVVQPVVIASTTSTTTHQESGDKPSKPKKASLLPTPAISILGEAPSRPATTITSTSSSIPSLLEANFDDLSEKIHNSLNKRKKLHEKNDTLIHHHQNNNNNNNNNNSNAKKKLKNGSKSHHHHHHHHSNHNNEENSDEEDGYDDEEEAQDKDERAPQLYDASANYFKPSVSTKTPLLATPPVSAQVKNSQPISLLDLFKTSNGPSLLGNGPGEPFVNPIITEKENNKPTSAAQHNTSDPDDDEMVSVDSIKEKLEKKREYMEIHKDIKKKEAEKAVQMKEKAAQIKEKVLCHFYVEGRCQKGDKCTFSHNTRYIYIWSRIFWHELTQA